MNIAFDCPHCGLSMEAPIDSNLGRVQCLGCSKEFAVEASQPVIPVVMARPVSPPVIPPAPHLPPPYAPQNRSKQPLRPHGYDGTRIAPPTGKKPSFDEDKRPFYALGVVGAMLVGMVFWLWNYDSKPPSDGKSAIEEVVGPQIPEAPDADKIKLNSELKAIKDALAAKEKRETEQIDEQDRQEKEIQKRIDANRLKQHEAERDQIAQDVFDGDATVAEAYLQGLQNVIFSAADVMNDGNPSNDLKSDQELKAFVVKGLISQFKSNSTLNKWAMEHQKDLEKFVPELVRKSLPKFGSVASSSNFDFSKYRSTGSGFFISSNGWILTNEHVVKNSKEVELRLRDGKLIQAKVVKTDETNDLALLKAELSANSWLAVTKGTLDLSIGQTVFTVGYPDPTVQGVEPKFTDGRISAASGMGDRKDSYQTTVPVQHGNSGGALVDFASGWVVGVVNAKLESSSGISADNVSYSIKGNVVSAFLESVPEAKAAVAKVLPKQLSKGDERAVIERATDSSVLILRPR